jgi:hypothetical protein
MALPYSFIGGGTYVNPATIVSQLIALSDQPDWFFVKDITNWGSAAAVSPVYSEWYSSMVVGSYLGLAQTVTTNALSSIIGTTNGFTFINQASPPTFSKVAITAINGTTFVVSTANTAGLSVGDTVRLINVSGALEISGSTLYQITAITTNTSITLGYGATAATAGLIIANGTTGFYQKVYPSKYYPGARPIAYITQANPAKVYFFRPNDFTPGEIVDFQIPVPYGMINLSNLTKASPAGAPRVLVVTNTATESSITINVDTTGFPAFVYPTSATVQGGPSPATCFPAGSGIVPYNGSATIPQSPPGTNLLDAFDNRNQYVMQIGTSAVGIAGATMQWMAFKCDYFNAITNA